MSEENLELMRQIAAAANKTDASLLDDLLAPGVFWNVKQTAPDLVGTYHGVAEVRHFFAQWEQAWEEWDWSYPEMRAVGDTVLARMHLWGRGRSSGVESENDIWQLWTFRGGKVVYYEDFATEAEALEAAGLSEAMPKENVEVVRRAYEAFVAGGMEAAEPFLHPDVLWEDRPDLPGAGVHRGHAGFQTAVSRFYDAFEELTISPEQLIDAGRWIVVAHRWQGRGKEGGVPFDTVDWSVFTVENGLITRRQAFTERTKALEAAGLSE